MNCTELMEVSGYSQPSISLLRRQGVSDEEIILRGQARKKRQKPRVLRDTKKLAQITGYAESTISQYLSRGFTENEIIEKSKNKKSSNRKCNIKVKMLAEYTGYTSNTIERYLRKMSMEEILERAEHYKKPNNTIRKHIDRLEKVTGYHRNTIFRMLEQGLPDTEIVEKSNRPYAHEPGLRVLAYKGILGKHKRK